MPSVTLFSNEKVFCDLYRCLAFKITNKHRIKYVTNAAHMRACVCVCLLRQSCSHITLILCLITVLFSGNFWAFMRTEFLCISVLRVASGPRVKLASCKSALNPQVVCSTDRSKAVVPVLVLLFVSLWSFRGSFCSCVFQSF